jgi:hypothetical protein
MTVEASSGKFFFLKRKNGSLRQSNGNYDFDFVWPQCFTIRFRLLGQSQSETKPFPELYFRGRRSSSVADFSGLSHNWGFLFVPPRRLYNLHV